MANGDFDFTAGQILTAAQVDDYLMLQAVQKFATSAARDSALTSRKREGMVTYQDDTNTLTVYTGSVWSTIGPVHGALISFDPVVTQSGTVTHTVNNSTYRRVGREISWRFTISITGSGTASNVVTLSLPVNTAYASELAVCGHFEIYDTSANQVFQGSAVTNTTGTVRGRAGFAVIGTPLAGLVYLGTNGFTAALASGDIIAGYMTYEAAADA